MTPRPLRSLTDAETTRRQLLAMATVGGAGVVGVTAAGPAAAAGAVGNPRGTHDYLLTVLGTTDRHGNIYNWDYFKDAE